MPTVASRTSAYLAASNIASISITVQGRGINSIRTTEENILFCFSFHCSFYLQYGGAIPFHFTYSVLWVIQCVCECDTDRGGNIL